MGTVRWVPHLELGDLTTRIHVVWTELLAAQLIEEGAHLVCSGSAELWAGESEAALCRYGGCNSGVKPGHEKVGGPLKSVVLTTETLSGKAAFRGVRAAAHFTCSLWNE